MRTGIIGTKVGNTSFFNDDGSVIPVTIVKIDDCVVSEGKIDLEAVRSAVVAQRLGTGASLLKRDDKR